MRVHVVDPSAYTLPYDHALCRSLAAVGAEVTLFTSRFAYGRAPVADGYARRELFYRLAPGGPEGSRIGRGTRTAVKLAEHVPDMLRYRRAAREAQVVHFQWLALQHLDGHLLPARRSAAGVRRPLVLSAHDILPREPRPGQRAAQRRLYERMDAIVVHSRRGRERLTGELGLAPERVHVIPHGVLRPWEDALGGEGADGGEAGESAGAEQRLPPELAGEPVAETAGDGGGQVALLFGLLRPYKGVGDLLQAWREAGAQLPEGAELWVVGMARMDVAGLREAAAGVARASGHPVRLLARFVTDEEIGALMRRADLVVLPYRQIDQSGVAFTALGAGVPLLLSDVGGFPEIAETGAAQTVPAGDPPALAAALARLLGEPATLAAMAESARAAADGPYAWEGVARMTVALYHALLGENPGR